MDRSDIAPRQKILDAALELFANRGYAGTSVQNIVDAARVTKPVLYYYFRNKSDLYQALVDTAHDERHRVMREAAARGRDVESKLVEIIAALFQFLQAHRALVGLAFATTFAAREELPREIQYLEKARRNFEVVQGIIRDGQTNGSLSNAFNTEELARGIWGMMNIYIMAELVTPGGPPDPKQAASIVRLFLHGAAAKSSRRSH